MSKITLDAGATVRWLAYVAALLLVTSTGLQMLRYLGDHDHLFGLLQLFSLNGEQNIPAFFSTGLLLVAALLLATIATLEKSIQSGNATHWWVLATGFLLMAVDESVSIHEMLISPMRKLLGGHDLGIFYFAWVVPALGLIVALAIYFLPFVLRLPRRTAIVFLVAAAIYLGGAIGVELIEGKYREANGTDLLFHLMVSLEEGMEMLGALVFIQALLGYIRGHHMPMQIALRDAAADVRADMAPRVAPRPEPPPESALMRSGRE